MCNEKDKLFSKKKKKQETNKKTETESEDEPEIECTQSNSDLSSYATWYVLI